MLPLPFAQSALTMVSKSAVLEDIDDINDSELTGIKDDATILIKSCELIAPMTRIRGKFKLTSTSITFVPDQQQPIRSKRCENEINLAMHPPPLAASKSTSPTSQFYTKVNAQTLNTFTFSSNSSLHSTPSNPNKDKDKDKDTGTTPKLTEKDSENDYEIKLNDNESIQSFQSYATETISNASSNHSNVSQLEQMVLSNHSSGRGSRARRNSNDNDLKEYWIATNVCSSYQQVGGTRYRLMSAHRFWFIDELNEIYYRRYQLRNCAFELFFNDETSWLFHFYDESTRNDVFNAIIALEPGNLIESVEFFQNPKTALKSSQIHYKWCRREMTNFEYLMKLNTLAGRTFNDLTQYPVLPWVVTDFESETIDLKNKKIYRDLSKPIGALDEESLIKFKTRYELLKEDDEEHCFMYGTHYSSIGNIL